MEVTWTGVDRIIQTVEAGRLPVKAGQRCTPWTQGCLNFVIECGIRFKVVL